MANKTIYQGDSYQSLRPLYTLTFLDDQGNPLNLSGHTIRTTFKLEPTDPATDPNDANAYIRHHIRFDVAGDVISSSGLVPRDVAEDGMLDEHLSSTESSLLPTDVPLYSDVELVTPLGEKISWVYEEHLTVKPAYTNRSGDE